MLVDHDRVGPLKLRSGLGHGPGQGNEFIAGHETGGTDQERRDLHVGVTIVGQIVDDCGNLLRAQGVAMNLRPYRFEAFRRRRWRYRHPIAGGFGKAPECRIGKADLVGSNECVVIRDEQGGEQDL